MKKIIGACLLLLMVPLGILGAETLEKVDPSHYEAAKTFLQLQDNPGVMEESYQQASNEIVTKFQLEIQPKIKRSFTEDEVRRLHFFWYSRLKEMISYSKIEELVIPVIIKNFTLEELREANRFYQSPTGRKMTEIQPIIMNETRVAGEEMGRKMADKEWIEATRRELRIQFPQWKDVLD